MTQLIDQPCWWRTRGTDWQDGTFRGFGMAQVTTAIIETNDHSLIMVDLYYVSFAAKQPDGITSPEPQPEPTSDDAAMAQFGRDVLAVLKRCISDCEESIDIDDIATCAWSNDLLELTEFDAAKHEKRFRDHQYTDGDSIYVWGTDDAK